MGLALSSWRRAEILRVVYLHLLCSVRSVIPLMFLQVLEPFCPLSEQETSDQEELDVTDPHSATVNITSETELNATHLPSDSSSPTLRELSCSPLLVDTVAVSVSLPALNHSSLLNADADVSSLSAPLSDCASASQPNLVPVAPLSVSLSDSHLGPLSVRHESCEPPQPNPSPSDSQPCVDANTCPDLIILPTSHLNVAPPSQRNELRSSQAHNSSDSVV